MSRVHRRPTAIPDDGPDLKTLDGLQFSMGREMFEAPPQASRGFEIEQVIFEH